MTLLDANILLNAYDAESPFHEKSAHWVQGLFNSGETVGLPWQTIHAFLRVRSNVRIFARPVPPEESLQIVSAWLNLPGVVIVLPGPRHFELLRKFMETGAAYGPLVSDAVLAALALEHGATLASADRDFARFPNLAFFNPLN